MMMLDNDVRDGFVGHGRAFILRLQFTVIIGMRQKGGKTTTCALTYF
jgi:hypothetical protein